MIKRIMLFPFWLLSKGIGLIFKIVQTLLSGVFGIIKFIIHRVLGGVFGALLGLLFGEGKLRVKLFKRKKKK